MPLWCHDVQFVFLQCLCAAMMCSLCSFNAFVMPRCAVCVPSMPLWCHDVQFVFLQCFCDATICSLCSFNAFVMPRCAVCVPSMPLWCHDVQFVFLQCFCDATMCSLCSFNAFVMPRCAVCVPSMPLWCHDVQFVFLQCLCDATMCSSCFFNAFVMPCFAVNNEWLTDYAVYSKWLVLISGMHWKMFVHFSTTRKIQPRELDLLTLKWYPGFPRVLKSPEFWFFKTQDLKSPEIGPWCWKSHEKMLNLASFFLRNQVDESVIF